jgi:hypothetical protein
VLEAGPIPLESPLPSIFALVILEMEFHQLFRAGLEPLFSTSASQVKEDYRLEPLRLVYFLLTTLGGPQGHLEKKDGGGGKAKGGEQRLESS